MRTNPFTLDNSTWEALDAPIAVTPHPTTPYCELWPSRLLSLTSLQLDTAVPTLSQLPTGTAKLDFNLPKARLSVKASSFVPGSQPRGGVSPSTNFATNFPLPPALSSASTALKEHSTAAGSSVQLNWGASPPRAAKGAQSSELTKQCKVCQKDLGKASFVEKQWTKTKSCCVDCAGAKADHAELDYLDAVVRGQMLRDELNVVRCCRCHQDRPATTFPDGLFTFASAYQQGKRLTQHSQNDPLKSAICLKCHSRPNMQLGASSPPSAHQRVPPQPLMQSVHQWFQ